MYKDNLIDMCVRGKATLDDLDNYVERWHTSDIDCDLNEYLGLTESEYGKWLKTGTDDILNNVLHRRIAESEKRMAYVSVEEKPI